MQGDTRPWLVIQDIFSLKTLAGDARGYKTLAGYTSTDLSSGIQVQRYIPWLEVQIQTLAGDTS